MEPRIVPQILYVSVAVPPAPVRVPSQKPLALSVMSITLSANDRVDNEMLPEAFCRFPRIYLVVEENPGKPRLGDYHIIGWV